VSSDSSESSSEWVQIIVQKLHVNGIIVFSWLGPEQSVTWHYWKGNHNTCQGVTWHYWKGNHNTCQRVTWHYWKDNCDTCQCVTWHYSKGNHYTWIMDMTLFKRQSWHMSKWDERHILKSDYSRYHGNQHKKTMWCWVMKHKVIRHIKNVDNCPSYIFSMWHVTFKKVDKSRPQMWQFYIECM
jgi:hypothetical protein